MLGEFAFDTGDAVQQPEGMKVAVLLSTHNGAEHLSEQLDSIARQTHQNWVIHICESGSSVLVVYVAQQDR